VTIYIRDSVSEKLRCSIANATERNWQEHTHSVQQWVSLRQNSTLSHTGLQTLPPTCLPPPAIRSTAEPPGGRLSNCSSRRVQFSFILWSGGNRTPSHKLFRIFTSTTAGCLIENKTKQRISVQNLRFCLQPTFSSQGCAMGTRGSNGQFPDCYTAEPVQISYEFARRFQQNIWYITITILNIIQHPAFYLKQKQKNIVSEE
jgi:hypothetical protein